MNIYHVTDKRFRQYGSIVRGYDFAELICEMKKIHIPEKIVYVASDPRLEKLSIFREFQESFYGGLPAELGYCMGHNRKLNGLEYHRSSEVNIAVTEHVVMLGRQQDIDEAGFYDSSKVEMFYIPEGLAVEFYATTLHYCACHVREEGYCHATFLPRGTNTPLDPGFAPVRKEDMSLSARNKWLMVHPEASIPDLPVRITGENLVFSPEDLQL